MEQASACALQPLERSASWLPLSSSLRLIVVLNEKLLEVMGDDVTQEQAFAHANDVLKNAVGGISDMRQRHITWSLLLDVLARGQIRRTPEPDARHGGLVCRLEHFVASRDLAAAVALINVQ